MSTCGFGSRHGAFPFSSANQSLAVRSHGWRTTSLVAAANWPTWAASPATPSAASASSQLDAAQPAPAATQWVAIEGFRSAKCGKGRSRK
jgi:hypothetical protein